MLSMAASWEGAASGLFELVYRESGGARCRRKNQGIDCGVVFLPRCKERMEKSRRVGIRAGYSRMKLSGTLHVALKSAA